jgi:CHAD domain-containing protein
VPANPRQQFRVLQEDVVPLAAIMDAKLRDVAVQLVRCDAALRRRCDRDSVHALRVATRRARAVLWSMKPWIRRQRYRAAAANLRAIARLIAPMRDMDVLMDSVLARVFAKAGLSSREWHQVRADLLRSRRRIRNEMRLAIDSGRFRQIMQETDALLRAGPALRRRSVPEACDCWRKRVVRGLAGFDRQARQARRKDLHRIRILAKRCRYSLEALGRQASRSSLHRLRDIQNALGRYCDARLAAAWLKSAESVRAKALRERLLQAARVQKKRRAQIALAALHAPV